MKCAAKMVISDKEGWLVIYEQKTEAKGIGGREVKERGRENIQGQMTEAKRERGGEREGEGGGEENIHVRGLATSESCMKEKPPSWADCWPTSNPGNVGDGTEGGM